MRRRRLMAGALALGLAPQTRLWAAEPAAAPFDAQTVRKRARALADAAFQAPDTKLPDALEKLTYDEYRTIRFDPAQALWRGRGLPFEAQFFHRGFLYTDRVDIFEVADGQAQPIALPARTCSTSAPAAATGDERSRLRRRSACMRRSTGPTISTRSASSSAPAISARSAKGQGYGLSARGLSINTADPGGEEFPAFRQLLARTSAARHQQHGRHALLDSPSAAAAFRFTIRPGDDTVFDVETDAVSARGYRPGRHRAP